MVLGNMIGLLLFLAVVQLVTTTGKPEKNIVQWFKTPRARAEHQPKCHIRTTWTHYLNMYSLTCYQCGDYQRSIALYRNGELMDAADVTTCKHYDVAGSVTVVDDGKGSNHKIEYDMTDKTCNLVYYGENKREKEEACPHDRHKPKTVSRYYNGWKRVDKPWTAGVVRAEYTIYYDKSCKSTRGWKSERKPVEMICYDCGRNFVVKIFDKEDEVATVTSGTCRSPDVENSIDILSSPTSSSTAVSIQFKLYTGKCIARTCRGGSLHPEIINEGCVSQAEKTIDFSRKTKNGWKPNNSM